MDDFLLSSERINSALLNHHINFLSGEITDESVTEIIRWIAYENTLETEVPLTLFINSMGGSLTDAFALIDIMHNSHRKIRTFGIGNVMSAAFLVFTSGLKGERYIGKNTSIMCHQYTGEIYGKHHDLTAQFKETESLNRRMVDVLKRATYLDEKTIKRRLLPPSDVWLTPQEVIDLGIADNFIS
jgi:ATP-dependent Clp protease protease subunit